MAFWELEKYASRIAFIEDRLEVSYGELARECDALSEHLASGHEGRVLVFCLCRNTTAAVVGYLSALRVGAVPLLLDASIESGLLSDLLEAYRPSSIWAPVDAAQEALEVLTPRYQSRNYALLDTRATNSPTLHPQLALLMSTSGSTGSPKLVRLSRTNLESNTAAIVEYLNIKSDERAISSLQMSYVYGLSVINTHLHAGASVALTDLAPYTKGFWQLFSDVQATSFAGVPFMYEMLDKLRFTVKEPPHSLRTMTQAGGKLSPQLHEKYARWAREFGVDFIVMYGASEATARMGYLPPKMALEKAGFMGVPIPKGRFEIVGEDGAVVTEPGRAGELVYYGENVFMGYSLGSADLACGDEMGGRLETGDIAEFDKDGYYRIVGRKKRFVKILGRRTSLDEVESLLKRRLGVVEVACAGIDDLIGVFLVDDAQVDDARACVHDVMGVNPRQVKIVVLEEIPKNHSGKTRYAELEKML